MSLMFDARSNASNARSASPYIDEADDISIRPTKGKGKGRNKNAGPRHDYICVYSILTCLLGIDDEFVGSQKRVHSF